MQTCFNLILLVVDVDILAYHFKSNSITKLTHGKVYILHKNNHSRHLEKYVVIRPKQCGNCAFHIISTLGN